MDRFTAAILACAALLFAGLFALVVMTAPTPPPASVACTVGADCTPSPRPPGTYNSDPIPPSPRSTLTPPRLTQP